MADSPSPADDVVTDDVPSDEPADAADASLTGESTEVDLLADEPFIRYQNAFYRVMTMAGAGLVLILGVTGAIMSRTLDPQPPIQWMWIDLALTAILFTWYALGLRCRLDVAQSWVEINAKYSTRRFARRDVVSAEPDGSIWGGFRPAGRPLIFHLENGKRLKAPACLPSDRLGMARAVEELQDTFGHPEDVELAEREAAVAERLASMSPDATAAESLQRRLESMTPEGDAADVEDSGPSDEPLTTEVTSESGDSTTDPAPTTESEPGD